MEGAGPGTLFGGRYALRRRLAQGRDLERWSAHDTTLEREVALTIVDSDHPNRAGILDAARRAAGVEDTRLVRILDVGSQDGNSFIVEESMSGSETLAEILLQGPLPAEEARRIAGETATGLETAGQRGLHHLRLSPQCVLIAPDGAIRVSGVAVAAAIDGPDAQEPDPATASRRDALCVVAVAYAALTGRWPLDEQISEVEPAPRVAGGVAAPSEIASGVPGDLDALCRTTLNEGAGPLTPGDFASQIAPWSRERVHRGGVEPTVVLHLPAWDDAGVPTVPTVPTVPAGTEPTVSLSAHDLQAHDRSTHDLPAQDPWTRSADAGPQPVGQVPAAGATVGNKAAAAGAAATKAVGAALTNAGAAAGAVGDRLGSFTKAAADKGTRTGTDRGTERMTLPQTLVGHYEGEHFDDEPPLPMLPASTAQTPSRNQSKVVMAIVTAFVGLALLVGFYGARGPTSDTSEARTTPKRTVTVNAPPVTVPASPAPQAAKTAAGPIAILSATGFDPEGDRNEKGSQAGRVYDGDPATTWTSEGYNSAEFGKLKKGVGVLVDLGQPTATHQATLDLGSEPVDVTVYAATNPDLEGATVIGKADAATGRIELKAAKGMPEAQYIIVWFTKLAPDGGQFRASLSEIALT